MPYTVPFESHHVDEYTRRRNRHNELFRLMLQLSRFVLSVVLSSFAIAYGTKIARPIRELKTGIEKSDSSSLYDLPSGLDKDDVTWALV